MQPELIKDIVTGKHECAFSVSEKGEYIPCSHQLWEKTFAASVAALTEQCKTFLNLGTKERGQIVYDAIYFHANVASSQDPDEEGEVRVLGEPIYPVGPTPRKQRQ
eukprot:4487353-Pleurochrysis_carterae.AAC.1